MLAVGGCCGDLGSKLTAGVVVLATLVGIAAGLVVSRLTEVQCGDPVSLSTCFEVHRLSPGESAGIGLLAAVVIVAGVGAVGVRRGRAR